jgi:hypothetical protein
MKTKKKTRRAATRRSSLPKLLDPSAQHHPPPVVPLKERRLRFGQTWEYAPAPETFEYIRIPPRHELFIDGNFSTPASGKYFDSVNPATEEKLSEIASAGESDVARAVAAARQAGEKVWCKLSGRERGKYLYRIARIIQEKARELAVLETIDGGKPIKESRDIDLPWSPLTFSIMPAGPTNCATPSPGESRSRWVSQLKLFPGTFRS